MKGITRTPITQQPPAPFPPDAAIARAIPGLRSPLAIAHVGQLTTEAGTNLAWRCEFSLHGRSAVLDAIRKRLAEFATASRLAGVQAAPAMEGGAA